jgi:cellulose biosynthesis protein BcsQ
MALARDPATGSAIDARFGELRGWADYVLIDTSPAIDEINNAWFYVADWLLLPTLTERPSIDQLRDSTWAYIAAAHEAAAQAGRSAAQVRGIVPNRYTPNTHVDRVNATFLHKLYGDRCRIFPLIGYAPIWNTCAQLRMSMTAMAEYRGNIGYRRQAMLAMQDLMPVVDSLLALQPAAVLS